MKKSLVLSIFLCLCVSFVIAAPTTYQFSFTAADLMSYEFVDGADGSSAAGNGLFDGARLIRNGTSSGTGSARSYVASQHDAFLDKVNAGYKLNQFNLWGFNGKGANWGEDFKAEAWRSTTQPENWWSYKTAWPWGTPPTGYNTNSLLGFYTNYEDLTQGFGFYDTDLESKVFTFYVTFDTDDMYWGQATGTAPNTLPQLTFWFGGYLTNGDLYEGNMVLTGTQIVPAPAAIALASLGLGMVRWLRGRKNI